MITEKELIDLRNHYYEMATGRKPPRGETSHTHQMMKMHIYNKQEITVWTVLFNFVTWIAENMIKNGKFKLKLINIPQVIKFGFRTYEFIRDLIKAQKKK